MHWSPCASTSVQRGTLAGRNRRNREADDMNFRTVEPALKDVLNGIAVGQIQLPDFQRGWVVMCCSWKAAVATT